jgi:hypothetical protein
MPYGYVVNSNPDPVRVFFSRDIPGAEAQSTLIPPNGRIPWPNPAYFDRVSYLDGDGDITVELDAGDGDYNIIRLGG